jgi:putative transposase
MVEADHPCLSLARQCELLGLARSSLYYKPLGEGEENLALMRCIDEAYTRWPFYGVRRMVVHLGREGYAVNPKRVRRLMRLMGLEAIYPKKRLSAPGEAHKRYPYLLVGVEVVMPNQVWGADITYIRLQRGFLYLVAIMDWQSRYVVSWALSGRLEAEFCVQALQEALEVAQPQIFNTDQGGQFTSEAFTGRLEDHGIAISMDGRGRVYDNIFVERLWRSVKYEEVYLKDYADPGQARSGLETYFRFYNEQRPHQALGYRTPAEVYWGMTGVERQGATARPVAGTPVALRAPYVPATIGQ